MKFTFASTTLLLSTLLLFQLWQVRGHGRLMDPPSRNAIWRFGFYNPVDQKDNELWCGGVKVQWELNGGKCGVCGDPWNEPRPRSHEIGGIFANGIIGRLYIRGQLVEIEVELTSNHMGYFETRLCPLNKNDANAESEECFESHPLYLEGQTTFRYNIPDNTTKHQIIKYKVQLPSDITCSHCVIRWMHYTNHLKGVCENGTIAVGCGNQEMYRNCADIAIVSNIEEFGPIGHIPMIPISQHHNPYAIKLENSVQHGINENTLVVRSQVCTAIGKYQGIGYFNAWCMSSCLKYPPTCPENACRCFVSCAPKAELSSEVQEEERTFCEHDCLQSSSSERCSKFCSCF